MKKGIRLFTWSMVLAMGLSVCACTTTTQTETKETSATTQETEEETETETTATEETSDPWDSYANAKTVEGATGIANSSLGSNINDVLSGGSLQGFWESGCWYFSDKPCQVMVPDNGYEIEGVSFKRIRFWKDGDENVSKVSFCVRSNEFLPRTEAEALGSAELNFDSESAKSVFEQALTEAFGDSVSTTILSDWGNCEATVWEHKETTIAMICGVDCYGVSGNNEFMIEVYNADYSGHLLTGEDAEVRELILRMFACLGQDLETAKAMFEDIMGVPLENEQNDPGVYYYSIDLTFNGINFNQAIFKLNPSGNVYDIYLVNDASSTAECNEYYDALYSRLGNIYNGSGIPTNSIEYEGIITGSWDGNWIIIGVSTSGDYSRLNVVFNNESLREA